MSCGDDEEVITGIRGKIPSSSPYVLPYPVGTAYEVTQGIGGTFSHMGASTFAWDFDMLIGTVITASREGVVSAIQENLNDGDPQANYVHILHSDGSIARYLHLTNAGALVEPGDIVNQGDTIALSGNSGFSTGPHLHFDVIDPSSCENNSTNRCQTQSIKFSNSSNPVPNRGGRFLAMPY